MKVVGHQERGKLHYLLFVRIRAIRGSTRFLFQPRITRIGTNEKGQKNEEQKN